MTVQHIAQVLEQPAEAFGHVGLRMLMVCLANHTDEDGLCWPSVGKLAGESGQSERTVRRQLEELAAQGWLEKVERRRRGDGTLGVWLYRLSVDRLGQHRPRRHQRSRVAGGGQAETGPRDQWPPAAGGRGAPAATGGIHQRPPVAAQEPSSEPSTVEEPAHSSTRGAATPAEEINGELVGQVLEQARTLLVTRRRYTKADAARSVGHRTERVRALVESAPDAPVSLLAAVAVDDTPGQALAPYRSRARP